MMNDTYLFLQLDIDPSATSGESPSAVLSPLEEIFQVTKPRWKTNQYITERMHTHTHSSLLKNCVTHLSIFSGGHMEMSAPPKRRLLMSGHAVGMDQGHTYTQSSCAWDHRPNCPGAPPPPPTYHPLPAPRRETNCECYWFPQQICAVQWVNKMDGVVRLSSGKVFWQHASGRVQHSAG